MKTKEPLNPKVESEELGDETLKNANPEPTDQPTNQDNYQEHIPIAALETEPETTDNQEVVSFRGLAIGEPHDDIEEEEDEVDLVGVLAVGEDSAEKYDKMSQTELVLVLEVLVKNEDINFIRNHIGYVKASFRKNLKDESLDNYEKTISQQEETETVQLTAEKETDPLVKRFEDALLVYKDKKAQHDHAAEKQKFENLKAKEQILEELRHLIESEEELKKTYDKFRELQEKWRNFGPVPQSAKNTLWNNYHFLVEKFFDKIKINKELKDLDLKKNLEQKTLLCEKAEELLLEPSIIISFQRLQKLHEAWKETGPVPTDKKDEIWDRFKAATEKLNRRRQDHYDSLRNDQQKNLEAKLLLCEKAELLSVTTPETPRQWQNLTNQINELFLAWKTIGFAPKKINNEVWNRFRAALDAFFRNKKEFFGKFKENQTENYNQKLNLCMQAEALKDSTDWRRTTNELIALQQEWKKIGPVPNKFSDKIWKRFRTACDEFFMRKDQHISSLEGTQEENLKLKKELISKITTWDYSSNNNENLRTINEFQRQWMEIGHVPIKFKDKLQAEYRKSIDDQFEKLGISQKAKSTLSFRSKIESIKQAPNATQVISKERSILLKRISDLQYEIKVWENNIGFFASSKKADILKSEFEEKIERARQEITILEEKVRILREQ
jgi:predicted XRE-type DNA-binding protein